MQTQHQVRKCGPCQFCCTTAYVAELDKPANIPCKHLCSTGCGIYTDPKKPQVCSDFKCHWLQGLMPRHLRPDKTGAFVRWSKMYKDIPWSSKHKGGIAIYEQNKGGALKNKKLKQWISETMERSIRVQRSDPAFMTMVKDKKYPPGIPIAIIHVPSGSITSVSGHFFQYTENNNAA